MNATRTCTVEGCGRGDIHARGMCGMHYERMRTTGLTYLVSPEPGQCNIAECSRGGKLTRGLCGKHYARWWKRGTTDLLPVRTLAERLASGLARQPNGCLEWTGRTNDFGYGTLLLNGKPQRTHRVAWELANGPIPEGMLICHRCDNPPCCDPDHLFLGTKADNYNDMVAKGRSGTDHNKLKTHCAQNHEFDSTNTYIGPQGWRQCRICKTTRQILRRKTEREASLSIQSPGNSQMHSEDRTLR